MGNEYFAVLYTELGEKHVVLLSAKDGLEAMEEILKLMETDYIECVKYDVYQAYCCGSGER